MAKINRQSKSNKPAAKKSTTKTVASKAAPKKTVAPIAAENVVAVPVAEEKVETVVETRSYVLKWVNKWSREEGFVADIHAEAHHFINTYDMASAKTFASEEAAKEAISVLAAIGEANNNDFYVILA